MDIPKANYMGRTPYFNMGMINCRAYQEFFGEEKSFTPATFIIFNIVISFYINNLQYQSPKVKEFTKVIDNKLFLGITNKWILAHAVYAGITSPTTIITAMKEIESSGLVEVSFEQDEEIRFNYKYYHFTDTAVNMARYSPDKDEMPVKDETYKEWQPSNDTRVFVAEMQRICGDKYHYDFKKDTGVPYKYMIKLDECIYLLKKQTYVSRYKFGGEELPVMSMKELADIAGKVTLYSKGSTNLRDIFLFFRNGKYTSPFVEYYKKMHPDVLKSTATHIQYAIEQNPYLPDLLKPIEDTVINMNNKSMLEMLYRFTNYYGDVDVQKSIEEFNKHNHTDINYQKKIVFFKWYLEAYKEYEDYFKQSGKDPKYHSLDEWMSCTNIKDDRIGSVWWRYISFVYKREHCWLVDRQVVADSIIKSIDEQEYRSSYDD